MGGGLPKQFRRIGGTCILRLSCDALGSHGSVDDIYVVAHPDWMAETEVALEGQGKLRAVCAGGQTRQESVLNALRAMPLQKDDIVLIHDAARPFVTDAVIDDVLRALQETGAAVAAVPVTDTVWQAEENGARFLSAPIPREGLYAAQTPQGFRFGLICAAHEEAARTGLSATDDGGLAKAYGARVALAAGDCANRKVTTEADLPPAGQDGQYGQYGLDGQNVLRVGTGFDVHALVPGRRLVLGGVEIPFEKGLLGHSDADVLLHALMDAMLGALALGDIGQHFPDTEAQYKGISSLELLAQVRRLVGERGYRVQSVDTTVLCERPRLAGHREAIRRSIAGALSLDADSVSVKATTTEGLGFTGREEGIGAQAVVLLQRQAEGGTAPRKAE
jgi:2-C-methyl-D-erythritol 4-phosphate cytidylyltransferase/2-C-methyl-D-erythritol 2,4-cyclodiphosphate synthase